MVTVYLLDINVLLALFDPQHAQHEDAHVWFSLNQGRGWATCPFTDNGFVRISSSPSYPTRPGDASSILTALMTFCESPFHVFWPADIRLGILLSRSTVLLHNHVTDLYLLGLTIHHGGKLATFDRRIPAALIDGGAAAVTLLPITES